MSARRPAKRPPARVAAPRAALDKASPESARETIARYRVLSSGISTPVGAVYRGALVTGEELGDADRVVALLARGAIEEVVDDTD